MWLSMSTKPAKRRAEGAERPGAKDAFDPEPTRTLGPDEAPTPTWVPIVGAIVIVGVGIAVVGRMAMDEPATARSVPTPALAASSIPASGAATLPGASDQPPSVAQGNRPFRPTPEQVREAKRRLDEARAAKAAAQPSAP
jgi:hypothetical protein